MKNNGTQADYLTDMYISKRNKSKQKIKGKLILSPKL